MTTNKRPLRVSFFVHDLASNPIVRAAPLAEALRREGLEVEMVGFLISGQQVYAPYRDRFAYKTIPINGRLRGQITELARLATGDIIYACKPIATTLLPALLASGFSRRHPLLLDVEDNELWIGEEALGRAGLGASLLKYWRLRNTYALHPFTRLALGVSVVSRKLQRRYGGNIVLHGPDEDLYDPARPGLAPAKCRARFGLSADAPLVLFAGVPREHKGLDTLIHALRDSRLSTIKLVLAGPPDDPVFRQADAALPGRVTRLGLVPNHDMPALIAACDIIPTPQLDNDFTQSQIPAKLLEGMAMAKYVIASRVSDLPTLLGEGEKAPRGWLHPPGDAAGLADCLAEVLRDADESGRRARAAREWFLENASLAAIRRRVRPLLAECSARV